MQADLIALWCVPRSRSTAFERMIYERGDYLVLHEPFSRVCDFGSVDLHGRICTSQEEVMTAISDLADGQRVFFKDTTDFRFDRIADHPEFVKRCRNAAMVRNPDDTVRSHLRMQSDAKSLAMGFEQLWEIVSLVTSMGLPMHLVDGDSLVSSPEREVRLFCNAMEMPFMAESLHFRKSSPASWAATERWHLPASESKALGVSTSMGQDLPKSLELLAESYVQDQLPFYELIVSALNSGISRR